MNKNPIILNSIEQLPNTYDLYRTSQSLAIIDAILMPEWEFRYFSFNKYWDTNQSMASMRDGCGSHYYILFDNIKNICLGKLYDNVNNFEKNADINKIDEYTYFLQEPAFENDIATCYFYKLSNDSKWEVIPPIQNIDFLGFLKNKEKAYKVWAESYYEITLLEKPIIDIFNYKPITESIVKSLNPECSILELQNDLHEIGYPYQNI